MSNPLEDIRKLIDGMDLDDKSSSDKQPFSTQVKSSIGMNMVIGTLDEFAGIKDFKLRLCHLQKDFEIEHLEGIMSSETIEKVAERTAEQLRNNVAVVEGDDSINMLMGHGAIDGILTQSVALASAVTFTLVVHIPTVVMVSNIVGPDNVRDAIILLSAFSASSFPEVGGNLCSQLQTAILGIYAESYDEVADMLRDGVLPLLTVVNPTELKKAAEKK